MGHKSFLTYEAQGIHNLPLQNIYEREEATFEDTFECVHVFKVPKILILLQVRCWTGLRPMMMEPSR